MEECHEDSPQLTGRIDTHKEVEVTAVVVTTLIIVMLEGRLIEAVNFLFVERQATM